MRRLTDGNFAILKNAPALSEVKSLDGMVRMQVPAEEMDDLATLAQGQPDDEEPSALFGRLKGEGLAGEGLDPVDPRVAAQLEELGRGFAWSIPNDERAEDLVALLRRAHARRKSFLWAFGQTYCLPESGIARCLHVARHVPAGGRILLVGDDDLLSLPLAALGFEVTAIDIDPLVIGFIQRAAVDEGLDVDARVYDVLAPLDPAMVGRYDAVFTDPMSYEKCFLAFWSRALAVTKVGGRVITCVQPYTRHLFARVAAQLPVAVRRYRYRFSGYYYYDFAENLYRSDLVELERVAGELPWAPEQRIPFEDITEGMISGGYHALGEATGMRLGMNRALSGEGLVDGLQRSGWYEVAGSAHHEEGRYLHAWIATEEGGHVAVVVDKQRAFVAFNSYPWEEERENWLQTALAQSVRGMKQGLWYADAPRLPARPVSLHGGHGDDDAA